MPKALAASFALTVERGESPFRSNDGNPKLGSHVPIPLDCARCGLEECGPGSRFGDAGLSRGTLS
eukprot:7683511-Alexandrium_andersonii.AAC.1